MKKIILISTVLLSLNLLAETSQKLQKIESSSAKSYWLQNAKTPLFSMVLYLGDGSFNDPKGISGLASSSLALAFEGTNKYSEEEISKFFDNYGASYGSDVKHEYTSFYLSGLIEDMEPLVKMVCHVFKEANYPAQKIQSYKKRLVADMENLSTSPEGIAERVFRAEVLRHHSGLSIPSSGLKSDLVKLRANDLKKSLNYLTQKVRRKIYLTGSEEVKKLPALMEKECGWSENPKYSRQEAIKPIKHHNPKPKIVFVPVKNSNQAQVRIGRLLNGPATEKNLEALALLKNYLAGSGFISELFTELRVKRGLTYTVRAYADMQAMYGRSGVGTFTKSERINEMLSTIKMIFSNLKKGKFDPERLKLVRKNLMGGYLFSFEQDENLLENIMYLQHIGKKEEDLYLFPKRVEKVTKTQLINAMKDSFDWNDLTIVIVGDKSLQSKLRKWGRVHTVKWQDYL